MQSNLKILAFHESPPKKIKFGVRPFNLYKSLEKLGVIMYYLPDFHYRKKTFLDVKRMSYLFNFLVQKDDKTFFLVENFQQVKLLKFLKNFNIPIILDIRDDPIEQSIGYGHPFDKKHIKIWEERIKYNIDLVDFFLIQTESHINIYDSKIREKCILVPNASDPSHFKYNPYKRKNKIGILTGAAPGRGLETFLKAARILKSKNYDITVEIGWPEDRETFLFTKYMKKTYSEKWINYHNDIFHSTNAPDFLGSLDISVIPHKKNTYFDIITPVKLFDSMSSGRPLVVTSCLEQSKIVKEEKCGLVCNFTPEDMAKKLGTLLDDKNLAENLGKNGRTAIENKYNWDLMGKRIVNKLSGRNK